MKNYIVMNVEQKWKLAVKSYVHIHHNINIIVLSVIIYILVAKPILDWYMIGRKKSKMYKIIALMGKSGSGKDTILTSLIQHFPNTFNEIISCTSRPIRENEKEDVNYHFLTKQDFLTKVAEDKMLEYTLFNDWFYGTCFDNLKEDKINVGVYNPTGVRLLLDNPNVAVLPIYITAKDKTRLMRQLLREVNPDVNEIIRRYGTDEKDFSTINDIIQDQKYIIYNEDITPSEAARQVRVIIEDWTKEIN